MGLILHLFFLSDTQEIVGEAWGVFCFFVDNFMLLLFVEPWHKPFV
jgi:hypothetical protein